MPTYNRRQFIPHAIECFLNQDYANRELVILDDGADPINDLVPVDERILYVRLEQKITLGAKLNLACQQARGEIVAHWDDDDWYAPRRLSYQVAALADDEIDICGINRLLYYDLQSGRAYEYVYPPEYRAWLLGSELCYPKKYWEGHRFVENNVGMDGRFVWGADPHRVLPLKDHTFAVHMIHDSNISPKKTEGSWWHAHPVAAIAEVLGADWEFYRPDQSRPVNYPRARTARTETIAVSWSRESRPVALKPTIEHAPASALVNRETNISDGKEGVSVVIPHGGEGRLPHLKATLANLRRCQGVSEIIVVEMSTTPYALDVARRWADKYVFMRQQKVFERARALNLGSCFAEYDLILWLDNDLILPVDFVKRAAADSRARKLDYLVPFSHLRYLSPADSQTVMRGERNPIDCQPVNVLRSRDAIGGAGLVRRSFLSHYGGLPEGFRGWGGEDNAWIHKAQLLGRVACTSFRDQILHHLFHPLSGGYGGAAHKTHPDYAANLVLMNQVCALRDSAEFLRRYPPPTHFPCPWETEKRIVFITDETNTAQKDISQAAAKKLYELFGVTVEFVKAVDGEDALAQLCTEPPAALIVFGSRLVEKVVPSFVSAMLAKRLLIVADEQLALDEIETKTLGQCGAVLTTAITAKDDCIQSGLRPWEGIVQSATESDAHSFVLTLVQALSVVLGRSDSFDQDADKELQSAVKVSVQQDRSTDLPVWCYWEGACPGWIKACQQTILAHAPNACLLTPEEFDRRRDVDRDIDLSRLQVAHRADFIRAFLLARYGGLWIDSDCLVMQPLRPLIDKLGEYDFLAHRERNGYISNGFIGAQPGSFVADQFYRRLCELLRSGKSLGWTSLGSEPLTEILNLRTPSWLELPCEEIQPVCWSHPEAFFTSGSDAEHEQVFNERAICYMLSNVAIQKHTAAHQSDDLLTEGSFFRYLLQRALSGKERQSPAPELTQETPANGSQGWCQLPFYLETISQVAPRRVLDLDVGIGRWGVLLRDLYEQNSDRGQWQIQLEGVTDPLENQLDLCHFFYDQIYVGEAATIIEEAEQRWDLTLFGNALKKWSRATGEAALRQALKKSAYVLINEADPNGSANGGTASRGNGHEDLPLSLRAFLASCREHLDVRHQTGEPGGEVYLLSELDPKKLKHESGFEGIFTDIYQSNLRVADESVSGPGSCLAQTEEIRQRLPMLVSAFDIKSMLDAPCGDFNWLRHVNLGLSQYIGADIVPQLVSQNRSRYEGRGREFVHLNIVTDLLPTVDLIFSRDCLVHFSYAEIMRALRNFTTSGATYLLMTTFTNRRTNTDIANGDWRPLNFQLAPFNLPSPLCVINEKCTEAGGMYADKSLGLWSLAGLTFGDPW